MTETTDQAYERGKKAGIELAAMYHHIMARNCDAECYSASGVNATEARRWMSKKRWHERSKAAIETLLQPISTDLK